MKPRILFTTLILIFSTLAWSQESPRTEDSTTNDQSPTNNEESAPDLELPYTQLLVPPMPVSALQMPLAFTSEIPRSNFIQGSLRFGTAYDDNVMATPTDHLNDVSYMIMPSLHIGQTRERWLWDFGYSPGVTINQKLSDQNQAAHNLDLLFTYRLSPHVTALINENFEKTSSVFSGFLSNSPSPVPGPLQQPNSSVITPLADRTGNTTVVDLNYQFDPSSLVGASGNFYFANYDSQPGTTSPTAALVDTHSWGGNAFYAHRFSNRYWGGVTYNFQRLLFNPGNRTDVSRPQLFYSVSNGRRVTFSIWAGPEQTTTSLPGAQTLSTTSVSQVNWHVAGGADLSWQGKRTNYRVSYLRQTSDGGGLAQAVRLEEVSGELQQRIAERWTADIGIGYGTNHPLTNFGGQTPYNSLIGNAGINCQLTDEFSFGLRYGRDQLTYQYPASVSAESNRNRAWISISYSFSRPLGR